MMVILDNTVYEVESDPTKKGQANSTHATRIVGWIGLEGEQSKSYSVAVLDGIKIKSRIFVAYPMDMKKDSILSKGWGV